MTAADQADTLPLNLLFSTLQVSKPAKSIGEVPSMSSTLKSRSIFDDVQPDAVFIQDLTQGLADTSWERQETSAWVSDEEDSDYIEAHLQTARSLSSKNLLPVTGNDLSGDNPSPASTNVSKNLSSPLSSSENGRHLAPIPPMVSDPVKSPSPELCELLKLSDLESWIDKFVEQDIDLDCIADLTDNDLIGLGMTKIGTRRKFQRIARQWMQQKSDRTVKKSGCF